MRLLICDYHLVFAESLAHVLIARGTNVVAVTHELDTALALLRSQSPDVCLLDVAFGPDRAHPRLTELRAAAPTVKLVLLCGQVDDQLLDAARAAQVSGIADKRQPVSDIVDMLDRVHRGESVLAHAQQARAIPRPRGRPANDAQRLAGYLTRRERQVLSALVCGEDTAKVARSLGIAEATARCHIQSVLTKMGAHSRLEVATTAVRYGMVSPETGEWLIPA